MLFSYYTNAAEFKRKQRKAMARGKIANKRMCMFDFVTET